MIFLTGNDSLEKVGKDFEDFIRESFSLHIHVL